MKRFFKYTLPVLALCALAACSEDATSDSNNGGGSPVDPNYGKELIAFSQEGSGISRAGFTRAGFSAQTKVYMRIKAQDGGTGVRYAEATATASADIAFSKTTHKNIMPGILGNHSDLTYESGQERYWDDAFGRDAKLTVYAFAIPDKTDATLPSWAKTSWTQVSSKTNPNWYTASADDVTVTWPNFSGTNPALDQSAKTTWETLDLAYSNNISSSGTGGCFTTWDYTNNYYTVLGGGQMKWVAKTNTTGETTGKFDQGHLVFNHAMSWIEINLKEGDGFDNTKDTDFKWTNNKASAAQNIKLVGFNTSGTFNVSTGVWTSPSSANITAMNEPTSTAAAQTTRQLYAYVVPGTNLFTTTSNVVEFEIDEGKYYVTGKQIADAIRDYYTNGNGKNDANADTYKSFTTLESGKHYVINLTVAKKGIDRITAAIIDWETVNSSDADADNVYCTFDFEDRNSKLTSGDANEFNIYRAAQTALNYISGVEDKNYEWTTGYNTNGKATKTWDATGTQWKTDWYWENNLTYYHFRAAGIHEGNASSHTITTDATTNVDYFAITSGAIGGGTYQDYTWGAPFVDQDGSDSNNDDAKLTYSTTYGFDGPNAGNSSPVHQISQALGATNDQIQMLLFHITSQIYVNLRTTTDASAVTLKDDSKTLTLAKVEILNFLADGKVLMGNGLVSTTTAEANRTSAVDMTNGTYASASGSEPAKVTGYSYGIVPQPLTYGTSGTIGLRITTPEGNQYVVKDLSTCYATVSTNNLSNPYNTTNTDGKYKIDRWYPNYQYTYTVTITKTGINRITAAVVPWETVTGDIGTINLEN